MTFAMGWRDRLAGKPFRPEHDIWEFPRQMAYERGRRLAAVWQGFGTTNKPEPPQPAPGLATPASWAGACRLITRTGARVGRHEQQTVLTSRGGTRA